VSAYVDERAERENFRARTVRPMGGCTPFHHRRISRAQSMDVLSSQANLAGYKAVVDAAGMFGQAIPMMMTAAGTVPAARTFIMGVGVAGLQAIATARRRLGAIVSGTDVREVNWDDEIVKGTLVAKDGKIVHPSLQQTGA
jgi:hypothetical protein